MKKLITAVFFVTAFSITSSTLQAQPAGPVERGPGVQPPPPPAGAPGMPAPPPRADRPLQQVTSFSGKAVKIMANDDYVYDAFYLLYGSDSLLVKFPAHLGTQVTPLVKSGANVTVTGILNTPPFGGKEIRMVSISANGKTINDAPPETAPVPTAEKFITGTAKIAAMQTDREGRVNGFILDNKNILRFPPPVINQLSTMAQTGDAITYTGVEKNTQTGEASAGDYTIIHCKTVTVNGQQYLVQ